MWPISVFPEKIITQSRDCLVLDGARFGKTCCSHISHQQFTSTNVATVLVIAGSREYPGAAALTAEAALRSGAGMVHLVVPASIRDILEVRTREVIVHGVPETATGSLHPQAREVIVALLNKAAAVALGPGLSADAETMQFVADLLNALELPHVVDADALMAVGKTTSLVPRVVTPHSGELARMVGGSKLTTVVERIDAAAQLAQRQQLVVLAKGAPTVVVLPDGRRIVNGSGNPRFGNGWIR